MGELVLSGLDGANPLGFLAALGVLEVLADRGVSVGLCWRDDGGWRPWLTGEVESVETLVGWINEDRLECLNESAINLEYDGKHDVKPPPGKFREYLEQLVQNTTRAQRRGVDLAGSFATDVATDNNGNTKPSALHFAAGQQQFLGMISELRVGVTTDDIREALLGPWRHARALPVMGWDSTITRDYALRASNPSNDKKLGVPGADWLAVRGLAFLPVVPVRQTLLTTGCTGGWKNGRLRWPLWTVPLPRDVVRSSLRLDYERMSSLEREARGVGVVFSCGIRRSDQGGYGSFEPARVA